MQREYNRVVDVADRAGESSRIAKLPRAMGARGGGKKASPRGPILEPRDKAPTLAEMGVDTLAGGIVTTIHDVYRDGAEAGLRHVDRAIEWHRAFDAQRRQVMVGGRSSEAAPKAST
jgi:hypothetical protein